MATSANSSLEDVDMIDVDVSDEEDALPGDLETISFDGEPAEAPRERKSQRELNTRARVRQTLQYMRTKHLKLDDFIHSVFYGDPVLRNDRDAKSSRAQLTSSHLFPTILEHLIKAPRTKSKGKRAHRSTAVIAEVTERSLVTELSAELDCFAEILHMDSGDNANLCALDSDETILKGIGMQARLVAPRLTRILYQISAGHGVVETSSNVVEAILCQLAFRKNRRNNRFQKLVCLYLKAKGTPTKVVNLFNQYGISMSYRWSTDAVRFFSNEELNAFGKRTTARLSSFIVYDNVRILFNKETQRVNNQTHGDNGTSITAVDIKDDGVLELLEDYGRTYQDMQLRLLAIPIHERLHLAPIDFFDLDATRQTNSFHVYLLIDVLLNSTAFEKYEHRSNPLLGQPLPLHQLPVGKAHRTTFTMLATLPIEEASYEGNLLVLDQCTQLLSGGKAPTSEQKSSLASHGIPFVGDQLTYSRLSTLKLMRRNDCNSFDRLDWMIPCFGWFHLLMLLGTSILQTHRGTHSSFGFSRSITNLDIKGLPEKGKKYYHHTVDVLLATDFKARALNLWLWATKKKTLNEVFDLLKSGDSPTIMVEFATKILSERASSTALKALADASKDDDEVLRDSILLTRDLLLYHQLQAVIRRGDVGHLEKLIPDLAIFFRGANNNNYAKMLVEYMQWARFESPPGISEVVRNTSWLVNLSGRPNNFYPTDLLQEHNNKLIKNVHAPMGKNATWDLINALTPAVPFLGRVVNLIESNYDLVHSSKHTLPDDGMDVDGLRRLYEQSQVYRYRPARERSSPEIKDVVHKGFHILNNTRWLKGLIEEREVYTDHCSQREKYSSDQVDTQDQEMNEAQAPGNVVMENEIDYDLLLDDDIYELV